MSTSQPRQVAPSGPLLAALVVLVVGVIALVVTTAGADDGETVRVGDLADVAARADGGPIRLSDAPGIAVTRARAATPYGGGRWGVADGTLDLNPTESLFALRLVDPVDDAPLSWCASSGRFEHPQGLRAYGPDGRLRDGAGPRGMDRAAIAIAGSGQVEVDPGRWVAGPPPRPGERDGRPAGPDCR